MSSPIRAVVAAHFGPNTGLVPLLLITASWVALTIFKPDAYVAESAWYIACVGAIVGIGLRLHFASHRSYLMPGLRETNRIVAFGVVFLAFLNIVLADRTRLASPTSLGLLWLGALICLYVAGLSKSMLAVMGIGMLLGAMLPGIWVRELFAQRLPSIGATWVLLTDVLLTIFIWRRIGTIRGRTWTLPGTGQPMLFEVRDRGSVPRSLDSMPQGVPDDVWGRARHFGFITIGRMTNFYSLVLLWSALAVFFRLIAPAYIFVMVGFAIPLIVPIAVLGVMPNISQRMFMLPLRRAEIVKCWGVALFVSLVKYWAALALPYSLLALATEPSLVVPLPHSLLLPATLAAQLPLFGVATAALSLKTASGIRYTVFLLPVFLIAMVGTPVWMSPTTVYAVLLGSIPVGLILIWFSYRRWCNTEVS
jgi:hypothetical protein